MNYFAQGAGNAIHLKQADPFAGRPVGRFEVPDTAQVVDLGDMVHFVAQTDTQEPFWTQTVLPLVDYGWATRVFSFGKWVFPQMNLRPSAETGPPRFLESYQMKAVTQMEHFNIGQHMSKEYAMTERGKLNQILNLKQMAISVQEGMNLRIQSELLNCNRRTRQFLEETGNYQPVDIKEGIQKEITRFCMLQKEDFGIEALTTELNEEVSRNGGIANTWIMTKRINFYTLTKDHRTIYNVGGPDAVSTLRDPNRSLMTGSTPIIYSKTYPERFGAELGPWHKDVQIGGYAWAGEIPNLNSGDYDETYLKAYTTKCLSVWIYDQEKDSIVEMKATEMLYYCNLFEKDGSIKVLPPTSNDPNYFTDVREDFGIYDVSTTLRPNYHPHLGKINPASLEGNPSNTGRNANRAPGNGKKGHRGTLPNKAPLKHIGHMDQKYFTATDYCSAGYQLMLRLSASMGVSVDDITAQYNAGMSLYKELCQRKVSLDVLNTTLKDVVIKNFLLEHETKVKKLDRYTVSDAFADYNKLKQVQVIPGLTTLVGPHAGASGDAQTRASPFNNFNDAKAVFDRAIKRPVSELKEVVKDFKELPEIKAYVGGNLESNEAHKSALDAFAAYSAVVNYLTEVDDAVENKAKEVFAYKDAKTGDKIWEDIVGSCTSEEYMNGLRELKDPVGRTMLPVPDGSGKISLAGYASFDGLKEMARLYNTREENGIKSYNLDQLRTANHFVNLIKKFSQSLFQILPECELFTDESIESVHSRDKSKEAVVAEKLLGMVGLPVWMNLKHAQTFIMSKDRGDAPNAQKPKKVSFGASGDAAEIKNMVELFRAVYNRYMGEPLLEIKQKLVELERYVDQNSSQKSTLDDIKNALGKIINPFTMVDGTTDIAQILAASGSLTLNAAKVDSSTFFQLNGRTAGTPDTVVDDVPLNRVYAAMFGSYQKYLYTRTVVEVANAILTLSNLNAIKEGLKSLKDEVFDLPMAKTIGDRIDALKDLIDAVFGKKSSTGKSSALKLPAYATNWKKTLNAMANDDKKDTPLLLTDMNLNLSGTTGLNNSAITDMLPDIAKNLKVNIPAFDGAISQAIIGAKATRQRIRPVGKPMMLTDEKMSSFYRTSLTFSVEQVKELLAIPTQDPLWENIFDLRVSDPSNFRHYLSRHHVQDMLKAIDEANKSFEPESIARYQSIRQLPDIFHDGDGTESAHSPLVSNGWSIPLLYQENKGTRVFLGTKPEGRSAEDRQHNANAYGVNVKDVTTNMRDLAYKISQQCSRGGIQLMAAIAYLVSPFKYKTLNSLLVHNIKFPIAFLLVRPHMNYVTETGAYLAPGLQTLGFTSVAGLDYVAGSNVLNKEWNAHLSMWFAPVVMHPENCYIQHNLAILYFGTGGGSKYYTPEKYNSTRPGHRTYKENYPSVMVIPLPKSEMVTADVISVTGRLPQSSSKAIRHDGNSYATHFSTAARANLTWKWNDAEVNGFESTLGPDGMTPKKNVVCPRGSAWYFNPFKDRGDPIGFWCPNQGHFGPEEGHGCKRVRQGGIAKWPKFNYQDKYPQLSS